MTSITPYKALRKCLKCGKQYIKKHKCPNKDIVTEYKRVIMEGRA